MSLLSNKRPQNKPLTRSQEISSYYMVAACVQRQKSNVIATPHRMCMKLCVCVCVVGLGEDTFYIQVYVRQVYQKYYACTILSVSTVKTFSQPFLHLNITSHRASESFCVS